MATLRTLGQIAYAAYEEKRCLGHAAWDDVHQLERDAWEAAAQAVENRFDDSPKTDRAQAVLKFIKMLFDWRRENKIHAIEAALILNTQIDMLLSEALDEQTKAFHRETKGG